jgi:hypothetical protein
MCSRDTPDTLGTSTTAPNNLNNIEVVYLGYSKLKLLTQPFLRQSELKHITSRAANATKNSKRADRKSAQKVVGGPNFAKI